MSGSDDAAGSWNEDGSGYILKISPGFCHLTSYAKRNVIDYDHASAATRTEAGEIVTEAKDFLELVERSIVANHPKLAR
jgi:hypothetical protein